MLCIRKHHVGYIASRGVFTADAFAKISGDDVMETRPLQTVSISPFSVWRVNNTLEHFDELEHPDLQACFLMQLPGNALFQGFSQSQHASGNGPFAPQRFAGPPDQ